LENKIKRCTFAANFLTAGKFFSHRRKIFFSPQEIFFLTAGKIFFHRRKIFFSPQENFFLTAGNFFSKRTEKFAVHKT
jgi:hypothetical protein